MSRKILLILLSVESIALFAAAAFAFSLPQYRDSIESLSGDLDLFYKILYSFALDILIEKYITFGLGFILLFALSLISLAILHGRFSKLYPIIYIYSFLILFIYPIGTLLGIFNLFFMYTNGENEEEVGVGVGVGEEVGGKERDKDLEIKESVLKNKFNKLKKSFTHLTRRIKPLRP